MSNNIKEVRIPLTKKEHKDLMKKKGNLTWKEWLLRHDLDKQY